MREYQLHINAFKAANSLKYQNNILYESFKAKMQIPETTEKATFWYSKAETAKKTSDDIFDYIDSLKSAILKEAGDNVKEGIVAKEEKRNVVQSFFIENENALQLYKRLKMYVSNALAIDPEIQKELQYRLPVLGASVDDEEKDKKLFIEIYFTDISLAATLSVLSNIQSAIRYDENLIATYCHNRINSIGGCGFWKRPQIIAAISSSYVKAGENVEITAGIGSFDRNLKPVFTINNKKISADDNTIAVYTINTKKQSGKYTVPVKIEYYEPDGRISSMEKNISYEVVNDTTFKK